MTEAESLLWHRIRKKQLRGIQFLRQKPIATFILDFYAKEIKLAIEVDGGQHFTDSHQAKDANRDAYLATLGIKTLRFTNTEILKNCTGVLYCIEQSIVSLTSFEGGRERFLRAGGC
jgi:very-short-patch-repair endonuclease